MAEHLNNNATTVTGKTCGICLEDSKDPLDLPCGHSFCHGCLGEWRSRYGVEEEMRSKCPICRAKIPPSKEMVTMLFACRAKKQELEDDNAISSEAYRSACRLLAQAEKEVGADWDGVTVLEDNNDRQTVFMPDYIIMAIRKGDIKSVLRWINSNRAEDRANATAGAEIMGMSVFMLASVYNNSTLMTLLLQLGANVDGRSSSGATAIGLMSCDYAFQCGDDVGSTVRLLLSWGASFFTDRGGSREECSNMARRNGLHHLADLMVSELGGRRCEIINLSSRPELNGMTCVADQYLPDSDQYRVTLETKSKEVLVLGPDNLKRRDRTPEDCGYYIEFKNGRTVRHDFDFSEECQAFVAALNNSGEKQPAVTEESKAAAEQAAAELLAELGLDDSPNESSSCRKAKTSKKKTRGKKKK
ncbi:hypothetical protein THAOC_03446 [Thalassiosira oceanica]|uniref:RING-type domain-containing protein n=1 Tax=Thalassiosira oceanica TaxID=159749 RepID=K0T7T7_THAOC|nr:hypothetical protein THAOC_03446 [Thalassiosira oceanica]|eukprot:EJK74853.1 hypothetical protein THAOC_03446 [Thalassiosira oceanica]